MIAYVLRYEGKPATAFSAADDLAALKKAAVWIEDHVVFARQSVSGLRIECAGLRFEVARVIA